jgi:hypothetical protein
MADGEIILYTNEDDERATCKEFLQVETAGDLPEASVVKISLTTAPNDFREAIAKTKQIAKEKAAGAKKGGKP